MKKLVPVILLLVSFLPVAKAQPIKWGQAVNGLQFGLEVQEGDFSFMYHIYVRANGRDVKLNSFVPTFKFYIKRGEVVYHLTPSEFKGITNLRLGNNMMVMNPYRNIDLKKDEEILLKSYVITKAFPKPDVPCHLMFGEYRDTTYFDATYIYTIINPDTVVFHSNNVALDYCQDYEHEQKLTVANAKFLNYLVNNPEATATEAASELAADENQHELVRGVAGRYLSDLNTQEARDILYNICTNSIDAELEEMLYFFFRTKDERGDILINKYFNNSNETIRAQVAWAIGLYQTSSHIKMLLSLLKDEKRHVRRIATESLQYFDDDIARDALYKMLKDNDLGVRTQAVYSLEKIGNKKSLKYLAEYLETEDPNNVGYINNAFRVAEQLSGQKLDKDINKLNDYIKKLEK